jgi:two-component system OmpR family response regulator
MHDKEIYGLTPLGEQQLRSAATDVSPAELDLLVRVDGVLTVGQIKAGMKPAPPADFDAVFSRLRDKELVQVRVDDPFADQFSFQPSLLALNRVSAEADAGAASLKKAGYFVRIARRRAAAAPASGAMSAVIVEDEPHLAKFLQQYLAFEGFEVRIAGTRDQVIAELRKQPLPDLVLLDVMLPDADGFDILYKMRQHPVLKDVPVIMLTGKATREAVIKGLAGGADGYVTKPFEADVLIEAVRTVLGLGGDPGAAPPADNWQDKAR